MHITEKKRVYTFVSCKTEPVLIFFRLENDDFNASNTVLKDFCREKVYLAWYVSKGNSIFFHVKPFFRGYFWVQGAHWPVYDNNQSNMASPNRVRLAASILKEIYKYSQILYVNFAMHSKFEVLTTFYIADWRCKSWFNRLYFVRK